MKNQIKQIRNIQELNQKAFAKSMMVSQSYLSELESGKHSASDMLIRLISLTYGVRKDWLLTGEGEIYISTVPIKYDEIISEIITMLSNMDDEQKKDILKLVEKEKLLNSLLAKDELMVSQD